MLLCDCREGHGVFVTGKYVTGEEVVGKYVTGEKVIGSCVTGEVIGICVTIRRVLW